MLDTQEKPGWWHLVLTHRPGQQSAFDEWKYCSKEKAENWIVLIREKLDYPMINIFKKHRRAPDKVLEEQEENRMRRLSDQVSEHKILVMLGKNLPKRYLKFVPLNDNGRTLNSPYVIVYKPSKREEAYQMARSIWNGFQQERGPYYIKEHKFYVWIPQEL